MTGEFVSGARCAEKILKGLSLNPDFRVAVDRKPGSRAMEAQFAG
jgi:hypothetical protein